MSCDEGCTPRSGSQHECRRLPSLFLKICQHSSRPVVVYSDNGLNLQAGEKELKITDKEWNVEKDIRAYAAYRDIEWHFSPPH